MARKLLSLSLSLSLSLIYIPVTIQENMLVPVWARGCNHYRTPLVSLKELMGFFFFVPISGLARYEWPLRTKNRYSQKNEK